MFMESKYSKVILNMQLVSINIPSTFRKMTCLTDYDYILLLITIKHIHYRVYIKTNWSLEYWMMKDISNKFQTERQQLLVIFYSYSICLGFEKNHISVDWNICRKQLLEKKKKKHACITLCDTGFLFFPTNKVNRISGIHVPGITQNIETAILTLVHVTSKATVQNKIQIYIPKHIQ